MKVGLMGATGLVGTEMLRLLEQRSFPVDELRLYASARSEGRLIPFAGDEVACRVLADGCFDGLDLVIVDVDDPISAEWSPKAAAAGAAGVGLGVGVVVSDDVRKMLREAAESREDAYPAGTFGAFVQEGQSAVLALVQLAMRTQRDAQVVAGMQVHAALARGLAAFPNSRLTKIEDLSGAEARFRADIDAAMAKLISQSDAIVKSGGDSAAEASARLRVAADTPLVRTPGPIFLFPFLPTQEITIRGAFPEWGPTWPRKIVRVEGGS